MSFEAVWREIEDAEKTLRKWKLQPRRSEPFKIHKLFSSLPRTSKRIAATSFQTPPYSSLEDETTKSAMQSVTDQSVLQPVHEVQTPRSCLTQARQEQDISVNELAAYFDEIVHLPKKMCIAAESMYA